MKIPGWWEFAILALAAFRIWRLASEDEIFQIPRRKIVRLPNKWQEGETIPDGYRIELAKFISCPYCLGFHISVVIWLLWLWQPEWTTGLSVPLAISAAVGLTEYFSGD